MPSGGRCISNVGAVACKDGKPCPADRPYCLWDADTCAAECIPRGPWDRDDHVFACDGPEDCVGVPCCTANGRSLCSMDCTESFMFAYRVCHTDADCPRPSRNETQRVEHHCVPARDDALPGMKVCRQTVVELR